MDCTWKRIKFLSKPHGLTLSKIRHINVVIRMDVTGVLVDLQYKAEGYFKTDDTNVNMHRVGGGEFESTYYDATSYNRGFITIGYID